MSRPKSTTLISILFLTMWKGAGAILSVATAILIANIFGATAATDAYFFARKLVSNIAMGFERAFHLVQVPPLIDRAKREGMAGLRTHLRRLSLQTLFITSGIAVLGVIFAPQIIRVLAPGFDAEQVALTVPILQILALTIPISAVTGLSGATLNALRLFSLPAVARLMPRLLILIALLMGPTALGIGVLPWALLVGTICMGLFFAWAIVKALKGPDGFDREKKPKETAKYGKRRIFAMVIAQIHMIGASWIDMAFASLSGTGGVATLEFGQRLTNIAPGVAANSVTSVYYTEFSRAVSEGDNLVFRQKIAEAMRAAFFFAVPLAIVIFPLSAPAVDVVLRHGAFTTTAADATVQIVQILALLLPINAVLGVTVTAIFADPNLPHIKVILSSTIVAILVRLGVVTLLIGSLGVLAVPISSLLSMSVLFLLCFSWVWSKIGQPLSGNDVKSLLAVTVAGGLSCATVLGLLELSLPLDPSRIATIGSMVLSAVGGWAVFVTVVCLLGVQEATQLKDKIARKWRK